jgi:hypothetical protein
VRRISGEAFQLSADQGIGEVFERMSESMLILGAPGAGKTTQLLDLAAALITRERAAKSGTKPRIPVVVDLADWSRSRRRRLTMFRSADGGPREFTEWLLASLRDRYGIPEAVGRVWLDDDRFTLLLDGLDEVGVADQERCVQEINALQTRRSVTRLAVCSRTADYDELSARLTLQGAVEIRPLTQEQVVAFFTQVSPSLGGVVDALRADSQLWELLTSPLMLNIVALAYGDRAAQILTAETDPAQRRTRLFDAYVVEVLARRRSPEHGGTEERLRAVRALARVTTRLDAGVSIVPLNAGTADRVADGAVTAVAQSWLWLPGGAACGVVVAATMGAWPGLVAGLLVWLFSLLVVVAYAPAMARVPRPFPLAVWVLVTTMSIVAVVLILRWLSLLLVSQPPLLVAGAALAVALAVATLFAFITITEEEEEGWWFVGGICVGGLLVSVLVLWLGVSRDVLVGWAAGAGGAISWGILLLVFWDRDPAVTSSPHDDTGARLVSTRIGLQAFLYTCVVVAVPVALAGGWSTISWSALVGWLVGVCYGFLPGLFVGYVLGGLLLRPIYAIAGEPFPWRRALLRFALDRSLLTVVDGEYRFIHLLVRDYLAECDPRRLAEGVDRRRAELAAPPLASTLPGHPPS